MWRGAAQRIDAFHLEQQHETALLALLAPARARLAALYGSGAPFADMRAGKQRILAQLASDIGALERREGVHYGVYDAWMARGLNNAQLASIATYYDCVPGFERLLAAQQGDLPRFYAAVRSLAAKSRDERHAELCTATPATAPAAAP
jgi:predicted aminopeptidase